MSTPKRTTMSKSHKRPNDKNEQETEREINNQKWCKASWFLKGVHGKVESEAIPRSWVSKSRSTVKWPSSDMNFKSAIECCLPPNQLDNWTSYVLVSCTHSVSTLQEARQLDTETSESDNMSEDEEDFVDGENTTTLGRGHRMLTKSTKLADYESGVSLETSETAAGEDDSASTSGTRVIPGAVGDLSRSAAALEKVTQNLYSIDHNVPDKNKIKTYAMKKALFKGHTPMSKPCSPGQDDVNDVNDEQLATSQVEEEGQTTMDSYEDTATPKRAMDISDLQMKRLLIKLAAESKLRHDEVMAKLQQLETKMSAVSKIAKRSRTTTSEECGNESLNTGEEFMHSSDEEVDIERQFSVDLPVHTFDDFWKLERELESSSLKRKAMRELFSSVGGRTENDMVLRGISKVIQRPQLAQHFNCGGTPRSGTLLVEPTDKSNFMGTQCQKLLLRVLRKKSPQETECSLKSRASEVLKRSSGLKGGAAYSAKKIRLATTLASPRTAPVANPNTGPGSSSEDESHS